MVKTTSNKADVRKGSTAKDTSRPGQNRTSQKKAAARGMRLDDPSILWDFIRDSDIQAIKTGIAEHLKLIVDESDLGKQYDIYFLYDEVMSITNYDANKLYSALSRGPKGKKDVLLILHSYGGSIEPAYRISKACKEYALAKFSVAIPRQAKSAATLLALGADEIHMGLVSELGPIDPQFKGKPALSSREAVEHIVGLCSRNPQTASMFAEYLSRTLPPEDLGYYARVAESAKQYAERLLRGRPLPTGETETSVALRLVYEYKDHGFVIDKDEAKSFLGEKIKVDTSEYLLSDRVHKFLEKAARNIKLQKGKELMLFGGITEDDILVQEK